MKIAVYLSALIFISYTLTACTPRDAAVISEKQRHDLDRKKQEKNDQIQKTKNMKYYPRDFAKISFFLQKHIEVLELLAVATGAADVTQSHYEINSREEKTDGVQTVFTLNNPINYLGISGKATQLATKLFVANSSVQSNGSKSINVVANEQRTSVDLNGKVGFSVDHKEMAYEISVASDPMDSKIIHLTAISKGQIMISKGDQMGVIPSIDLNIKMILDKDALEKSTFVVKNIDSKISYPNEEGTQTFSLFLSGADIKTDLRPQCPELIGNLGFKTGAPNAKKKSFKITPNEISFANGNVKHRLGDCPNRPSVDLSVLLDL